MGGKKNEESSSVQNKAVTEDGGDVGGAAPAQLSEFVVSVSAVLETTCPQLDHVAKSRVMHVVNRLVDKLHRAEEEKDTATLQLKGGTKTADASLL